MTLPIRVWLTPTIPNPWKVVLLLDELEVPYEIRAFRFDDIKKEPFIKLNPNASVPGKHSLQSFNLSLLRTGRCKRH